MGRQNDEIWKYVTRKNGGFKCNYCKRYFRRAGATRIKRHLSGEKGHDIEICTEVPEDVRAAALQATKGLCKKAKTASSSSKVEASRDRESIEVFEGLVPASTELMQLDDDELSPIELAQQFFLQGDMDTPQVLSNASVGQGLGSFQPESFGPVTGNASVIGPTSSGSPANVCTMPLPVVGGETAPHFPGGFNSIGYQDLLLHDPLPTFLMPTTLDGLPDETAAHVPGGFQPGRNGETGEMISRKRSADV